jgi:hypothetical protein
MADWEEDWENLNENIPDSEETKEVDKKNIYDDEREVVIIDKKEKTEQKDAIPKEDDYERKWREKNKVQIERKEKERKALENLSEADRAKKQQELSIIDDVQDLFMGFNNKKGDEPKDKQEKDEEVFLKNEKGFIDFGIKIAAKLNTKESYIDKSNKKGKEVQKQKNYYNSLKNH